MSLTFVTDPEFTPALRDGVARLWNDVNNAGGAVGFVPPTTVRDVMPHVERYAAELSAGTLRLVAGLTPDGTPAAVAFLAYNELRLSRHWAWLQTVMVSPAHQGSGHGAALLRTAEALARKEGLRAIRLSCRDGLGLERFYGALGYREIGRVPGALRVGVADEDDRDSVEFWLALD
ncbi:GNAT family N-acetyltransferase [Streptomyces sp. SL13]|uniref:GNAT family N-acetyltransferase n=1 Tax=Streptantibioticus silvisoli TaxID=2705255 RepID=A0AA90HAZ4_9ACTN|nr:GNAT family N-acetyltransferase [Streptantibioticus silvisoli]MDI5966565.1 GNAT family N-acetyltransferase [Streptantibioticus silvisoli]MDI5972275.1 GNAT family N-acetyltransferase [Streptantibioticus silvisoli]